MLTLNEISKKAEELYDKFEADYNNQTEPENNIVSELFTDDEIFDILMHELSEPNYEPELLYSQSTGHFDEQTLEQYLSMTDEDGEYIHKFDKEEFI